MSQKHPHEYWISKCIELAKKAKGRTGLNPMVGAIIVHDNRMIGEGYHEAFGQAHAEVNAIRSVSPMDQKLLAEATIYVSLEPCNHFGKTPPCAHLIIKNKIPRVVISSIDPNGNVQGNGIEYLKSHGVEVISGISKTDGDALILPFKIQQKFNRPYIILKWAESKDGFIGKNNTQVWLSGQESKIKVHEWRADSDAILVGTNTVIVDNPKLNVRWVEGKDPLRIIIDRFERIPKSHHVISDSLKTIIFSNPGRYQSFTNINKEIVVLNPEQETSTQILAYLMHHNLGILFIEGGSAILQHFIEQNLWDEARIIKTEHVLNQGIKAPSIKEKGCHSFRIGTDRIELIKNDHERKS